MSTTVRASIPRGFTLIELLIALGALAIALALALPAFSQARESTRAIAAEARLLQSLQSALARATLTGKRAVLCPSPDGRECASSPDWSRGWIAFLDEDGNREHAPAEPLILAEAALPGDVRLRSTLGRTRLVFQGNGGNLGSNVSFTLCDGRGARHAQALILANDGRLRHGTPAAASVAATCVR
jgi:type IV fimbrial biogenesis protein FimT